MRHGFFRYIIATVFIILGVILILENIGITTFNLGNAWFYIYPILFIVIGLKWIIDKIKYKGGSWEFGSFFLIFGTLLLLDRFHVIYFTFGDVFKLWPLLIVYIGFLFINPKRKGISVKFDTGNKKTEKNYNKSFFSIGDHEFNQPNWTVEPMNLSNLAGDFYFDFSKAFIPEKEIPITISALAGDVHILIPENVEFRVDASVKAGDIDVLGQTMDGINRSLTYTTDGYHSAIRKLDFALKLKAGSVRIDHV